MGRCRWSSRDDDEFSGGSSNQFEFTNNRCADTRLKPVWSYCLEGVICCVNKTGSGDFDCADVSVLEGLALLVAGRWLPMLCCSQLQAAQSCSELLALKVLSI